MADDTPASDIAVSSPSPQLRPFITKYAGFRVGGQSLGFHVGVPSTEVHLIISLRDPIEIVQMPNSKQSPGKLKALVSGLQSAPALIRQEREAFGLHVFIKPFGVQAVLGVASSEISSCVLELSDVWGPFATLVEQLRSANTWASRFAILDRAFLSRLHAIATPREVLWAWQSLASTHGTAGIQALADEIGWSRRYMSERFRDAIGATPKLAARVFRFERARVPVDRGSISQPGASRGNGRIHRSGSHDS